MRDQTMQAICQRLTARRLLKAGAQVERCRETAQNPCLNTSRTMRTSRMGEYHYWKNEDPDHAGLIHSALRPVSPIGEESTVSTSPPSNTHTNE